ncbi:MAG: hypothetical protein ACM3TR_11215 [Caulobacteraceae bacterium]
MQGNNNNGQNYFGGLTSEQIMRIVFEELSKSGFQPNNINNMIPSIIGRIFGGNGSMAGNNIMQMLMTSFMNSYFKRPQ